MAISIRNSAKGISSTTTTVPTTSVDATVGDIIVVQVANESTAGNALKTVSSISDGTANVYTKRFSTSQSPANVGAAEGFEVWWAYAANTLTTATITVTFSGTFDDSAMIVAVYQGFTGTAYQTAPWDTNASLPATAQSLLQTSPTVTGVSTDSTAGMLLFGYCIMTGSSEGAPAGFTEEQRANNSGAVLAEFTVFDDMAYSSAQSSVTIATQGGTLPVGWIAWADALTSPAGGGASPVTSPTLLMMGI